jgi:hypothetical protein
MLQEATAATPRRTRRHLVERSHAIDVRRMKRNGQIRSDETAITLCAIAGGGSSRIRLAHLERPVFGGVRTYFCCPACDRRCDLLYSRPSIACRRCHNLAYASENEARASRTLRGMLKRRDRLGQVEGGVIAPFPGKPKWRRWPRYLRTRREAMQRERDYWRIEGSAMLKKYLPKVSRSRGATAD